MKTHKIIFWITTSLIFIFEGLIPAFTSQTEMAKEGIRHLGYPEYFGNALVVFKVLGCIILIVPKFPKLIKEWAYAGFAFDFIFASISYFCVDGFGFFAIFPLIWLAILAASYNSFHKINLAKIA
ncbi:DoxX family protein [Flavobacterium sp. MAH-1]|uniref:DoxX family protein n=1 Tax=Flavobacterium agri TaxID=2743471 RepID=A0A7Y8Y4U5_9FLAO|nr:DoxX family protein [Flavobacterium agri]NUY82555.1 DoxX family protein [Flavobacterium agri]NYA72578.1 DoxX family protein [Flavobacterium agri]